MLHGSSTTWFQTSRYCRAKVEFNSINWVRHGSSTTFETGLRGILSNLLTFTTSICTLCSGAEWSILGATYDKRVPWPRCRSWEDSFSFRKQYIEDKIPAECCYDPTFRAHLLRSRERWVRSFFVKKYPIDIYAAVNVNAPRWDFKKCTNVPPGTTPKLHFPVNKLQIPYSWEMCNNLFKTREALYANRSYSR